MNQSVDLYTDELRPSREALQARSATLILLLGLLVVVLSAGIAHYRAAQSAKSLAAHEQRTEQLRQTVEQQSSAVAAQKPDAALESELREVTEALVRRERLLGRVEALVQGDSEGFSPALEGLARQVPDGLWLTGIELRAVSGEVVLKGQTESGSLVPVFLDQLGEEPTFSGRSFGAFRLLREEDSRWIGFHVATRRASGESQ